MSAQSAPGSKESKSVMAIVGLVVGIIALLTSLVPIVNNMSFVLGIAGLVFAVIGLVGTLRGRRSGKGVAIASLVINVLALVFVLASQSYYGAAIDEATKPAISTNEGTAGSTEEAQASANQNGSAASSESKYSITDEQLTGDSYSAHITGTFTNTSGQDLSYVEVDYNLFDAEGAQIGTAFTNTTNLADGATWKFDAYCTEGLSDIATFKLVDVTAH